MYLGSLAVIQNHERFSLIDMFIILLLTIISITSGNKLPINNSTFRPEPIEIVMMDDVEYSFYNYRVTWEEAKIICLGYKSQLATLDTEKKVLYVTRQLTDSNLDVEDVWIGSKKHLRGDWIWDANDEKLLPNIYFHDSTTIPKYQNRFTENDSRCLTLIRHHYHIPLLIPRRCSEQKSFTCERVTYSTSNVVKVFTVNIDNKMLVLYSANVTWSEAVFQCRQQGLQIAEISTLNEARSMTVGMLKVRPRSVESAWIAGYINNRVWTWLSSGTNILQNDLWHNSFVNSGNCLLLERHICERPRYLSLRCDRRRDFICQTPQEEKSVKEPVQVTVDHCKYWIILVPLNWNEANQFCKSLNFTLLSLDSPATVNHVVNIMFDNGKLLRHIWIGGKKEGSRNNLSEKAVWKWNDTGNVIPGPGQSFIPWCKDSRLFEQNSDCLNMDLEDINEPIVYGLNCNNKQRYICQEESAICTEMKNKLSPVNFNHSETISQLDTTTREFKVVDISEYNNNESTKVYQNLSQSTVVSLNDKNTKCNATKFHEETISKLSSTVKNRNFKEIIEYMVNQVNDNRSDKVYNNSITLLPHISKSEPYDKSSKPNYIQANKKTEQILSIKEDVSKIVHSSMEKNWQNLSSTILYTGISNLENPVTHISSLYTQNTIKSTFSPTPRNLFSTQVDRPLERNYGKSIKLSTSQNYDSNIMFNFGQIMKSTFDKDRTNNYDTQDSISSENPQEKQKFNNSLNKTTRNKNEVSTVRTTSTTKLEKRIQSLKNDGTKNVNDAKVNDIVNDFEHRVHDPNLKQEFLSLFTNNITGAKNNYVTPWNVLLNRIFQSYNNTNKNLIGFKVLEFP